MARTPVVELDADVVERLEDYVAEFARDFGVITRARWAAIYLQGLFLDGERKSIEPLSRRVSVPGWRGDTEQALQGFVNQSPWDEQAVLLRYRQRLAQAFADPSGVIVIDDTGFAKKGRHSVGVTRQYSGTLGKTDNCQVAVSLHYAAPNGDYPLALRLFLPDAWTSQPERMKAVHVPTAEQAPQTKGEIALTLLDQVRGEGLPHRAVVADAGYGLSVDFRRGLEERGEPYVVGIAGQEAVFAKPPEWAVRLATTETGRPPTRWYLTAETPPPTVVKRLAAGLERTAFSWRHGTKRPLQAEFAWLRVWPAHRWQHGRPPTIRLILTVMRDGYWSNGAPMARFATRCPTCRRRARWRRPSACGKPAGTWSRATSSSKRSWGWTISKDALGRAFTTMPPCAFWRTASWPSSGGAVRRQRWTQWPRRSRQSLFTPSLGLGPTTASSSDTAGGPACPAALAGLSVPL